MDGRAEGLRAPEGVWRCSNDRRATTNFSPDMQPRLEIAELPEEPGSPKTQRLLLMNTQQALYIYNQLSVDREPLRIVDFRQLGGAAGPAFPTCIAHTSAAADDFDVAVGLSTGEVVLLSLRAQLRAPAGNSRPVQSMCLNVDGSSNASRCVSVAWLPGSAGTAFVAAHRDGAVLLYHKVVGSSSDTKLLARSSSQGALRPPITQLQAPGCGGGVNAAAVSPDGQFVATACRDGVLRVCACPGGGLVAGFKSYYGGLHCCAWSPDGRYVAAGGEDDIVALYGLAERCVVAVCQGHTAWISGVAFDPWMCHTEGGQRLTAAAADGGGAAAAVAGGGGAAAAAAAGLAAGGAAVFSGSGGSEDRVYRLASVGQDCQLALWDVVVSEEAVAAAQQASSANASPERQPRPGLPASPSKHRGGRSSRSVSPTKRGSGGGGGPLTMFRTRSGAGPDPGALPAALAAGIIAPPLPRADWPLVTPAVLLKCHPEPLSGVAFNAGGLYTACHGSAVRHWQRPPLTPTAQMRRIDSLQGMA